MGCEIVSKVIDSLDIATEREMTNSVKCVSDQTIIRFIFSMSVQ